MAAVESPRSEAIQVIARIRPEDRVRGAGLLEQEDDSTVILLPLQPEANQDTRATVRPCRGDGAAKRFKIDRVFSPSASQEHIYEVVQPVAVSVTHGYNATIFAYGHTGSGKTHTMTGTSDDPGITPRTVCDIFRSINDAASKNSENMFLVRTSYVELYNNQFRNLLDWNHVEYKEQRDVDDVFQTARNAKIQVRESRLAGVHLSGPNLRAPVTSAENLMRIIAAGDDARAVGITNCNEHSSRSHAILTLYIESRASCDNDAEVRVGKLHLVDLAGSERLSSSGAEGSTLVETQSINLSLAALGDVLSALSRNVHMNSERDPQAIRPQRMQQVPYRNSKLTHLLKDSLGGNSKTLMIATLRATKESYTQNLMTLMYASRAKRIRNFTAVNRATPGDSGIHQVSAEIQTLKQRLLRRTEEFDRLCTMHCNDTHENHVLRQKLEELGRTNEDEKRAMERNVAQVIHNQAGQMALQRRQVTELQVRLQEELESGQHKCAIQKVEINNLRNMISALERVRSGHGATQEEVSDMQGVLEAWQAQATSAQAELLTMSEKLKVVAEQRSREKKRRQQLQCELDSLRIADGGADKATTTDVQEQEVGLKRQLITAESTIRQLGLELRTERRDAQALAADLQAKLCSLGGTLSERTNQCIAHSDAVQRLKVEIREKDVALQKVMMEWTHMHTRLATAVSETERVQGHLERIEPEHRSLRKNLRRIQGKMTAMELGTQALLQTKMHAIAQKHEECEAFRATLVASRSEATKSKISKEIHAMRASQLESAIVEVHEKNGSYEANDHVLRANNMTLVKQLHAAEEACRGIVGSKKETAVALQEAQNAQRVSEQRTHSVQEEALASVAYLQVQLEKVKSARALLASTACKNQQIMLQAHKTELVANETKNKTALIDAVDCAVNEALTRAQVASDDLVMSLAEERAMLQEEARMQLYNMQLGFDDRIYQSKQELKKTALCLGAAIADSNAAQGRAETLHVRIQEALEDNAVVLARRTEIELISQNLRVECSKLTNSLDIAHRKIDALQKANIALSAKLKLELAAANTHLKQAFFFRKEFARCRAESAARTIVETKNVRERHAAKIRNITSTYQEEEAALGMEVAHLKVEVINACLGAATATNALNGAECHIRALKLELASEGAAKLELQSRVEALDRLAGLMQDECRASTWLGLRAFFFAWREHTTRESKLRHTSISNKLLSFKVESLTAALCNCQKERDNRLTECGNLKISLSALNAELIANSREAAQRIKMLQGFLVRTGSVQLNIRRSCARKAADCLHERGLKATTFLTLISGLRQSDVAIRGSQQQGASVQLELQKVQMDLKKAWSAMDQLKQRARKHHAIHHLCRHSGQERARKQKRIADIQIRSLQGRLHEDAQAIRESLSDSALMNYAGAQKISALKMGLVQRSSDCALALSLLSRMSVQCCQQKRITEALRVEHGIASFEVGEVRKGSTWQSSWHKSRAKLSLLRLETYSYERRNIKHSSAIRASNQICDGVQQHYYGQLQSNEHFARRVLLSANSNAHTLRDAEARVKSGRFHFRRTYELDVERHNMELSDIESRQALDESLMRIALSNVQPGLKAPNSAAAWSTCFAIEFEEVTGLTRELVAGYGHKQSELRRSFVGLGAQLAREKEAHKDTVLATAKRVSTMTMSSAGCTTDALEAQARMVSLSDRLQMSTLEIERLNAEYTCTRAELIKIKARLHRDVSKTLKRCDVLERDKCGAEAQATGAKNKAIHLKREVASLLTERNRLKLCAVQMQTEVSHLQQESRSIRTAPRDHNSAERRIYSELPRQVAVLSQDIENPHTRGALQIILDKYILQILRFAFFFWNVPINIPPFNVLRSLNVNSESSCSISTLLGRFSREKKTRQELLTEAAGRWISPFGIDPTDTCETLMNAAIGESIGSTHLKPATPNALSSACLRFILEGNAYGVVSVLNAAGIRSLRYDLCDKGHLSSSAILPLHRAVSGFHFHGQERLLLETLAVLIQYGADILAVDHCGNSILHKALQVCTSSAVLSVVRFLLRSGADVNAQTGSRRDLDTPILTEIRRLRKRSPQVIELMCSYGADVNRASTNGETALTLILHCAQKRALKLGVGGGKSSSHCGKNFWVPVADLLVLRGATWDPALRDDQGRTQLHLLFSAPPPQVRDFGMLASLAESALDAGCDASAADSFGRTSADLVLQNFVSMTRRL